MPHSKTKTISVRLSEDEYRKIRQKCSHVGDLTLSEFARAAMIDALGSTEQSATSFEMRLAQVRRRLDRLEARVETMSRKNPE